MARLFVFWLALVSTGAWLRAEEKPAGDLDSLTRKRLSCWDVQYNAYELIPKLMAAGKREQVTAAIKVWRRHCGDPEAAFRAELLTEIHFDRYPKALLNEDYRRHMRVFQSYAESDFEYENSSDPGFSKAEAKFDRFLILLARKKLEQGGHKEPVNSLLLFYSLEFKKFYQTVRAKDYPDNQLKDDFKYRPPKKGAGFTAFLTGSSHTGGMADKAGSGFGGGLHGFLFFSRYYVGLKFNFFSIESFKFPGSITPSFGGQFGLTGGLRVWEDKQFSLLTGTGLAFFSYGSIDEEEASFNLPLTVAARYKLEPKSDWFFLLAYDYNIIFYERFGNGFDGHQMQFRFGIGWAGATKKKR